MSNLVDARLALVVHGLGYILVYIITLLELLAWSSFLHIDDLVSRSSSHFINASVSIAMKAWWKRQNLHLRE
jgi:hypothetical protein